MPQCASHRARTGTGARRGRRSVAAGRAARLRTAAAGPPGPPGCRLPALKELPARHQELHEELLILVDCLCLAGLITPAEISARRQQRLGAACCRELLTQPASARRLAEALGPGAVGCLLAASVGVRAAFGVATAGPDGEPQTPPTEPPTPEAVSDAASPTPEEQSPQSRSSVFKFFAWPFSSSQTPRPASSDPQSPPADPSSPGQAAAEAPASAGGVDAPEAGKPLTDKSDIHEFENSAPGASKTDKPKMGEPGACEFAAPAERLGDGGAASLLSIPKSQPVVLTVGGLIAADQGPAPRQLETLADSKTEVAECDPELLADPPLDQAELLAALPAGPATGASSAGGPASTSAAAGATPQRGSTARFFGRILGYGSSPEVPESLENALMGIHSIAQSIGQAAGLNAARQISQASKSFCEGLASYLPELVDDGPYIYVCGGSCGIAVDSAERFSPRTGLWESLPPMCVPRRACTAASIEGRFYVMGGVDVPRFNASVYSDSLQQPWVFENKYRPECFDPVTSTWELLPPMNRPYTHATAVSSGGLLYIFGGLSFGAVLDQAQRFDPARYQWESLEPMPTPRFECASAASHGLLYVLGGANPCGEPLSAAECYDPGSGRWQSLPRMSEARYGCAAASTGGRIYAFGGHGIWENLSSVETFDPEADHWTSLEPMSCRRNHCGAAVVCGRIYVFGGHTNGQDVITIECLDPKAGSWEVTALMARPRSHCMTATVQP